MDTHLLLSDIIPQCTSYSQVLEKLGKAKSGKTLKWLKNKIALLCFDCSHFSKEPKPKKKNLEKYLTPNTICRSTTLKNRLIKANLLVYECAECKLSSWRNEPISLQLDHINGTSTDNRLENLRLLCPNCHSQTETWGTKRFKSPDNHCLDCQTLIAQRSKRCNQCASKTRPNITKAIYPDTVELIKLVNELGYSKVGRNLGISGNAIKKYLAHRGFDPLSNA